jgi:hypothetical protein
LALRFRPQPFGALTDFSGVSLSRSGFSALSTDSPQPIACGRPLGSVDLLHLDRVG